MTATPSHVLITGASGFIGGALIQAWHPQRSVIALSRQKFDTPAPQLRGDFALFEDLRQLDDYNIGALIHLGAVTGGCCEEDGIGVNVAGTRRLLRYLLDRGCRKFVLASSMAATGCLDPNFVPQHLPISDDHPCLARDAYGVSKSLMEELIKYFARVQADSDWTLLRLGAVVEDDWKAPNIVAGSKLNIPFAELARVYVSDVVRAITLALDAPPRAGVRNYNVVAPDCSSGDMPHKILCAHFGERLNHIDWSHYEAAGHEHDALYAMHKIRDELGFAPQRATRFQDV